MSQVNGSVNGFHVGDGVAHGRRAAAPGVVVIVVTTPEYAGYPLEALLEPLKSGAAGYVFDAAAQREAVIAVQRVLSGWSPLGRPWTAHAHCQPSDEAPDQAAPDVRLTARERDVLRLLAAGKTNPEIACELMLSVGTVKGHVQHLLTKLGVSDRTQAAVRGLQLGLLHSGQA